MVARMTELWFNPSMKKALALRVLGDGSVSAAAEKLGVTYQAVDKWPEDLPARIADRVVAAAAREHPSDWHRIWPELAQPEQRAA